MSDGNRRIKAHAVLGATGRYGTGARNILPGSVELAVVIGFSRAISLKGREHGITERPTRGGSGKGREPDTTTRRVDSIPSTSEAEKSRLHAGAKKVDERTIVGNAEAATELFALDLGGASRRELGGIDDTVFVAIGPREALEASVRLGLAYRKEGLRPHGERDGHELVSAYGKRSLQLPERAIASAERCIDSDHFGSPFRTQHEESGRAGLPLG